MKFNLVNISITGSLLLAILLVTGQSPKENEMAIPSKNKNSIIQSQEQHRPYWPF